MAMASFMRLGAIEGVGSLSVRPALLARLCIQFVLRSAGNGKVNFTSRTGGVQDTTMHSGPPHILTQLATVIRLARLPSVLLQQWTLETFRSCLHRGHSLYCAPKMAKSIALSHGHRQAYSHVALVHRTAHPRNTVAQWRLWTPGTAYRRTCYPQDISWRIFRIEQLSSSREHAT